MPPEDGVPSGAGRIRRGQAEVVAAAVAFAASVPAGKLLLADIPPLALSGALYLSAGLACGLLLALSGRADAAPARNALRGGDWLWLAAAVGCGGVLAPLLLFAGLQRVSGHAAGLLLNFEAVFTVVLGVWLSGELLGRRGWMGAGAVLAGAVLLALHGGGAGAAGEAAAASPTDVVGVALVVGACALWGLDNNLTQRVSLRDARQIVAIKGLIGGATSLALAAAWGGFGQWSALHLLAAGALGANSFGLSIVLFVRGLRELGVLQAGTLFALAPGLAALMSWAFLGEPLTAWGGAALLVMTGGALLVATDRHEHVHAHEETEHVHEHVHDEFHRHEHAEGTTGGTPAGAHTHAHRHPALVHAHPHVHDAHHRHGH